MMRMTIDELIERSKNRDKIDFDKIPCLNSPDPLVAVAANSRLIVEPIWEKPIDELEGPLYQEYIKENPGYDSIYLRQEVLNRLLKAAENLPAGLKLILRAGHRPIAVQNKLLNSLTVEYFKNNPQANEKEALTFVRTFISDPAIALPPHCCGAAVDVDIYDLNTGQLINFGCPINTDSEIAFLHSDKISKEQYNNRIALLKAMLLAGFASYYGEWWHFTYGSQSWAHFYKRPASLYGLVEPTL